MKARSGRGGLLALAAVVTGAMLLSACGAEDASGSDSGQKTVTIEDNHGQIEVPVNPERVVALDNTVFQTLSDWGVPLVAAPKGVMGDLWPEYTDNSDVLDVGNHREPNLEVIIEADPDLVIGGHRFADYYDEIKSLVPTTIEITARDGHDHTEELKRQVTILGQIFDKEEEARALVDGLDDAVEAGRDAYDGVATVTGLITSGGKIAYAAPGTGRGVGQLFPILDLVPAIEQEAEDTSHGDEISLEAIAQANPDWLIVLDRDAAVQADGHVAAQQLIIEAEALQNVTAVQQGQVIVLDPTFYLDEGIQAYTTLYQTVADAFADAG